MMKFEVGSLAIFVITADESDALELESATIIVAPEFKSLFLDTRTRPSDEVIFGDVQYTIKLVSATDDYATVMVSKGSGAEASDSESDVIGEGSSDGLYGLHVIVTTADESDPLGLESATIIVGLNDRNYERDSSGSGGDPFDGAGTRDDSSGSGDDSRGDGGDSDVNVCDGMCELDGRCYDLGYRKSGDYCSDDYSFVGQKTAGAVCDNSFECSSNVCVDGECISSSLLRKILSWFRGIFGG